MSQADNLLLVRAYRFAGYDADDYALALDAGYSVPWPLDTPEPYWQDVRDAYLASDEGTAWRAEQQAAVAERAAVAKAEQRADELVRIAALDALIDDLPDEEVDTLTYVYPAWSGDGVVLEEGQKVRHNGILYSVVQPHTTQPDWAPDAAPALFARYRDPMAAPEPWEQLIPPETYNTGDRVTHDNPNDGGAVWIYESAIDANTTEPGRDGTSDRWWTPIEAV
jgi:hypothetical protein